MAAAVPTQFTLFNWNINFDFRASPAYAWPARKAAVIATICSVNADIVCLQELRDQSLQDLKMSPPIAATYDIVSARTNATPDAFCLVTMWKKTMLVCNYTQLAWFGSTGMSDVWTGRGHGRVMLICDFCRAGPFPCDSGNTVCVGNVHLGVDEQERRAQASILPKCDILCGDFNTFPDANPHMTGVQQCAIIEGRGYTNSVAYGVPLFMYRADFNTRIASTHLPYPYDRYTRYKGTPHAEAAPKKGETGSRLDHVFINKVTVRRLRVLETPYVVTLGMDGNTPIMPADLVFNPDQKTPITPSDHFGMFTRFEWV